MPHLPHPFRVSPARFHNYHTDIPTDQFFAICSKYYHTNVRGAASHSFLNPSNASSVDFGRLHRTPIAALLLARLAKTVRGGARCVSVVVSTLQSILNYKKILTSFESHVMQFMVLVFLVILLVPLGLGGAEVYLGLTRLHVQCDRPLPVWLLASGSVHCLMFLNTSVNSFSFPLSKITLLERANFLVSH